MFKNQLYLQGAFSNANNALLTGVFLIGFALALGANNLEIGILTAIPLLASLLQLVSAYILELTGTKKKTTIVATFVSQMLWILMVLMAFGILTDGKNLIYIVMVVLLISSLIGAIGSLSLLSWMKDIVPKERLARFFGKRNMYATFSASIVYLVGSYILDQYKNLEVYGYVFIVALILGLGGLWYLKDIPDYQRKIKAINPQKFLYRLLLPPRDVKFRPLLVFGLVWNFAVNIASPFFIVYMLQDLSLSFFMVSVYVMVDSIARIYGLSIWRKMADEEGAKPLMVVCATVTSFTPLTFLFINPTNSYLIPFIFVISAISYAGIDIAFGQLLFKSAPKRYDAYYLATFSSLTGFIASIGPIIGGLLAIILKNYHSLPFTDLLVPLKWVFLVSFILRVSTLPLIYRIYEPKAKDVKEILDRIKAVRLFSFFVDIYSFVDHTSKIILIPEKQIFILQRKMFKQAQKDIGGLFNTFSTKTIEKNQKK